MKIRELIEQLSHYDWDSIVEIGGALSTSGYTINAVEESSNLDSNKNRIIYLISYGVIDIDSDRAGANL